MMDNGGTNVRRIRYLGLDLGWTPRDSSGGVVLEPVEGGGVQMLAADSLRAHEDVLRWVSRHRQRAVTTVAFNAPVVVENLSGSRPCDRLLLEHFARFRIDEYANNTISASHPRTMAKALQRMGFDADLRADGDRIVETHGPAAQVMLFGVERPVRMKTGPMGGRKDAVDRMRELIIEHLMDPDAPLRLHESPALDTILDAHLPDLNGSRVGELEERLEAFLSAYTAAWLGELGAESCAFLGDLDTGYILLPDPSRAAVPAAE
jgi:predicted RNase H-like nuclease